MRHHERIKSLISLRVDGSVIGLDNSGTTAICVTQIKKKKRGGGERLCVGAIMSAPDAGREAANSSHRLCSHGNQYIFSSSDQRAKCKKYKIKSLKKALELVKGTVHPEISFPVTLFIHKDHFSVAEF